MASGSLDALASQFHDRLKIIKHRTPLDGASWYPWHSLAGIQLLEREMRLDLPALQGMIGSDRVLDVGCGDGDVAFFLESLGAQVDAVDHPATNYNRMEGVRTLARALNSPVRIHAADIDNRPALPASGYGLGIMLGVLYHLKNPYLVLETLARNVRHLYMSTRIASRTPDRKLGFGAYPLAYLVDDRELNDDPTNFWIFSEEALKRVIRRSGWNVVRSFTAGPAESDPVTSEGDARAFVLAESRLCGNQPGFQLGLGWHELEHGASRWTARRFTAGAELRQALAPATLRFLFQLPDSVVARRPRTVLNAAVNGIRLPASAFHTPGEQEYTATLPSLAAGHVQIEFELDAGVNIEGDERELGVQVYFQGAAPIQLY